MAPQRIGQPAPDLLKKLLLFRHPDTLVRALMKPKKPGLACLRTNCHRYLGPDTEAAKQFRCGGLVTVTLQFHRPAGSYCRPNDAAQAPARQKLRRNSRSPGTIRLDARFGFAAEDCLRIARIDEPRPVTI